MSTLRLVSACFRFVAVEALLPRRIYTLALLGLLLAGQTILVLNYAGGPGTGPGGVGLLLVLGMWGVAAPLCRPWLDEDARLGYAAFWLQAPRTPFKFYLARLLAILAWAAIASLAVVATALPTLTLPGPRVAALFAHLASLGWIPIILALLAFLGSGIGARNAGLFAYGILFGAYVLEGVTDALGAGALYQILRRLFPPVGSALDVAPFLERGDAAAAAAALGPLTAYAAAVAVLGLLVALRVPSRLGRGE